MCVRLVNVFFLYVFVQACARHIKQKRNKKIQFHLDTTEGFENDMRMALVGLRNFYTGTGGMQLNRQPTRRLFGNRTKHDRRMKKIDELIDGLQNENKGTFTLRPTKYRIVSKEIQKLEKIRQLLMMVRCDLVGYFCIHGFDPTSIDDAVSAIQGYQRELKNYIFFIKDCPERAVLPPKWSLEGFLVVKEVLAAIGKIEDKREESSEIHYANVQQPILCVG